MSYNKSDITLTITIFKKRVNAIDYINVKIYMMILPPYLFMNIIYRM